MFRRLLNRRKRSEWQTLLPTLTWWRVRYSDPVRATHGLQTVAAHLPNSIMVLGMQAAPLPMLWVGLPAGQAWCVEALQPYGVWLNAVVSELGLGSEDSGSEGIELSRTVPEFVSSTVDSWQQVTQWPSASAWMGLLAYSHLYIEESEETPAGDSEIASVAWPAANGQHPAMWQLPTPVLGIASQLAPVSVRSSPTPLLGVSEQSRTAEHSIYLGRNDGKQIYAPDRVQVWGDRRSLHKWTIQLILHELTNLDSPLVVIDGRGDMAEQLPLYKPFVAALKAQQLHYIHFEDDLRQQGFNPLQPLEWETVQQTADRWQRWLTSLGIWPSGELIDQQALCLNAVQDGVTTLPNLTRWFHNAPNLPQTAYVRIQRALRQVQQSRSYAPWLRRPRPIFERPLGLVFACANGTDTVRRTMTAALLDAALTMPDVTLILTGVPSVLLNTIPAAQLPRRVVMINGVKLEGSVAGIGRISNATKRRQMVERAFENPVEIYERLTIAPSDSVFWLTHPPIQTI